MRKLINLITEAQGHLDEYTGDGPLYHGTTVPALAYIVSENFISASHEEDDGVGVSLTTDFENAEGFSYRAYEPYGYEFEDQPEKVHERLDEFADGPVVIEFDVAKLRQHFQLVHYNDPGLGGMEEDEVRVMSNGIQNARDFFKQVHVGDDEIDWWLTYAEVTKDRDMFNAVSTLRGLYG